MTNRLDLYVPRQTDPAPVAQSEWREFVGSRKEAEEFAVRLAAEVSPEGTHRPLDIELLKETPRGNRYRVRARAYWDPPA